MKNSCPPYSSPVERLATRPGSALTSPRQYRLANIPVFSPAYALLYPQTFPLTPTPSCFLPIPLTPSPPHHPPTSLPQFGGIPHPSKPLPIPTCHGKSGPDLSTSQNHSHPANSTVTLAQPLPPPAHEPFLVLLNYLRGST